MSMMNILGARWLTGWSALAILIGGSSACSSGSNPNPAPASPISVTPSTLLFLQPSAPSQQFVVTDKNFNGSFIQSNSCTAIASVNAQTNPAVGPTAIWNVAPVGPGTCSVQITDGLATTMVVVAVNGPLTANPTSVSFQSTSSIAQSITVGAVGYTGAFTESDTCSGIAAIAPSGSNAATGPSAIFTVTPARIGACSIIFSVIGQNVTVLVTVL